MTFAGKLFLRGKIQVLTGLHIGTGSASGIGLIDNPVIRDPLTNRPIVPGSSLKGRLRHALETLIAERREEVVRLFGSPPEEQEHGAALTRLYARDSMLTAASAQSLESIDAESVYVEVKTENRIDRQSGTAEHPRQSERLPAGSELDLELIYNAYVVEEAGDDLQNLEASLSFVEDEYLGGSGSRGYGKVRFLVNELTWKALDDYLTGKEGKTKTTDRSTWLQDAFELIQVAAPARSR